jgi:hypothetical protein
MDRDERMFWGFLGFIFSFMLLLILTIWINKVYF